MAARHRLAAAACVGLLLPVGLAGTANAQSVGADIDLDIVHGIPDVAVDVVINDAVAIPGFEFGDIANDDDLGGLSVGDVITVEVLVAGTDTVAIPEQQLEVPAWAAGSLVAHLDAEGNPTLTPFEDDLSPLCEGEGGVVVRHTAAAPAVDVAVDGSVVGTFQNGEELSAALPEGDYEAEVRLAGTETVALGPLPLPIAAGTVVVVYAVGSAADETLDVLVDSYEVGTEDCTPEPTATAAPRPVPTAVPAGAAGSTGDSGPLALVVLGLGAVAAAGAGTVAVARSRRHGA
jgi:hypothetical protein